MQVKSLRFTSQCQSLGPTKNIDVVYNSVDFQVFNHEMDVTACKKEYQLNAAIQLCYIREV